MSNPGTGRKFDRSPRLQVDNEDQHSVRGAQLLLAGAILQQYCTAGEEEGEESEDGSDAIDVSFGVALICVRSQFLSTGGRKRSQPAILHEGFRQG